MNNLKFEITLGGAEKEVMTFYEVMDVFYDNGFGMSKEAVAEILENKHPMYEVKIIIE